MSMRVSLLGGFVCLNRGKAVRFPSRKVGALLAFLAYHRGKAISRDQLILLLWGDSTPHRGRANLRQSLFMLKEALGESAELLSISHSTVQCESTVIVDTAELLDAIQRKDVTFVTTSLNAVGGEFLSNLNLSEEVFQSWKSAEQIRLTSQLSSGVEHFLAEAQSAGNWQAIGALSAALLKLDAGHEGAHRALMLADLHRGNLLSAQSRYARLKRYLDEQLNAPPSPDTIVVEREIMRARKARNAIAPSRAASRCRITVLELHGPGCQDSSQDDLRDRLGLALSAFPAVELVAPNLVTELFQRGETIKNVMNEFALDAMAGGRISRQSDRLLFTPYWIEAGSSIQQWRESCSHADVDRLFAEAASGIVGAIAARQQGNQIHQGVGEASVRKLLAHVIALGTPGSLKDLRLAQDLCRITLATHPGHAAVAAILSELQFQEVWQEFTRGPSSASIMDKAEWAASVAIARDSELPEALLSCAYVKLVRHRFDEACALVAKAITNAPLSAEARIALAIINVYSGNNAAALSACDEAFRLAGAKSTKIRHWKGRALIGLNRLIEARDLADDLIEDAPEYKEGHLLKLRANAELGEIRIAQEAARNVAAIDPAFSTDERMRWEVYREKRIVVSMAEQFHNAGLP
jgi:DNA-binding SARP family transcriptional activator